MTTQHPTERRTEGLSGIIPIVVVPFDESGSVDQQALRRVVRFELEGGVDGIGANGFASEAYKLTDAERLLVANVVADEVAGSVPLLIGLAPGSVEAAVAQAEEFAHLEPAALMTLPPSTFGSRGDAVVEFYVEFARRSPAPVMIQQAHHVHAYSSSLLDPEDLAAVAEAAPLVQSFKLEGPAASDRIATLAAHLAGRGLGFFGGGGGTTFLEELSAGASGLIPGVGFNEWFVAAWGAWSAGNQKEGQRLLDEVGPLVTAVSGRGHEFSIHLRKHLLLRAGLISTAFVRRPTATVDDEAISSVLSLAEAIGIRLLNGSAR